MKLKLTDAQGALLGHVLKMLAIDGGYMAKVQCSNNLPSGNVVLEPGIVFEMSPHTAPALDKNNKRYIVVFLKEFAATIKGGQVVDLLD